MDFSKKYKQKLDEIKRTYPKLGGGSDVWVLGLYNAICEQQLLNEFITKTISINKTKQELTKRFPNKIDRITNSEKIDKDDFYKYFQINIFYKFINFKDIPEINKFMESFGWFPAFIQNPSSQSKFGKYSELNLKNLSSTSRNLVIRYDAKYDFEIDSSKQDFYYHLIPDILYKKIELMGLTPKNKEKVSSHPERIYLLNSASDEDYEEVALSLWVTWPQKTRDLIKSYYLLQIDVKNLIKDKKIKLYNDPMFSMANGAVWTYENIPPIYIKLINKILVNP
jgi:hypothetical protein